VVVIGLFSPFCVIIGAGALGGDLLMVELLFVFCVETLNGALNMLTCEKLVFLVKPVVLITRGLIVELELTVFNIIGVVEVVFAIINLTVMFGVLINFEVVEVSLGNVEILNDVFDTLIYHGILIFLVGVVVAFIIRGLIVVLGVVYNNVGVAEVVFVIIDLLVALYILIDCAVVVEILVNVYVLLIELVAAKSNDIFGVSVDCLVDGIVTVIVIGFVVVDTGGVGGNVGYVTLGVVAGACVVAVAVSIVVALLYSVFEIFTTTEPFETSFDSSVVFDDQVVLETVVPFIILFLTVVVGRTVVVVKYNVAISSGGLTSNKQMFVN